MSPTSTCVDPFFPETDKDTSSERKGTHVGCQRAKASSSSESYTPRNSHGSGPWPLGRPFSSTNRFPLPCYVPQGVSVFWGRIDLVPPLQEQVEVGPLTFAVLRHLTFLPPTEADPPGPVVLPPGTPAAAAAAAVRAASQLEPPALVPRDPPLSETP